MRVAASGAPAVAVSLYPCGKDNPLALAEQPFVDTREAMRAEPPRGKPALRDWALRLRAAEREAIEASFPVLITGLRDLPEFRAARAVLLYLAMPAEVPVEAVVAANPETAFYAPRCAPRRRRLTVHRYLPGETPLRPGPFGIREPDPARVPEADPAMLDVVLVPALLLGESGERLGYGGGYYDRFLPRLRAGCTTVGLLPDRLVLPRLPQDPWDQRIGIILTEFRVLRPGLPFRSG
jgi:5-formyltetrahydrofolate cyclo-ligase